MPATVAGLSHACNRLQCTPQLVSALLAATAGSAPRTTSYCCTYWSFGPILANNTATAAVEEKNILLVPGIQGGTVSLFTYV